jgi:hypothetical protein
MVPIWEDVLFCFELDTNDSCNPFNLVVKLAPCQAP